MSAGLTKVFRARLVVGIGMAVLALLPMPIQAQSVNDVAGAHGDVIVDGGLLVTSTVPGAATRSEPMNMNGRMFHQPDTILGDAFKPLDSGVGEVLVLLSMQ
jgi:hypothetical protein